MSRRFADIAFTPEVRAFQERAGSRAAYAKFDRDDAEPRDALGPAEIAFVGARDGFYQATVGSNGWPYVQFRGGPAGFVQALDGRTLAYADFRGNVQYVSNGNIAGAGAAATADGAPTMLFFMDYARRRRLKVWARARLVAARDDPPLIARLSPTAYDAKVERAVVLAVAAFDWNCPQHIVPRFTEAEIAAALAPIQERLAALEAENARLRAAAG
jgi:predicted pyridoxine 5'-phosphate oxidase superfamily flavin-nucleotide-binding protein